MTSRQTRLNRAPDLRFDDAGLRLEGESGPRRLVFRPSPPSLFTLKHEEFCLLDLCRGETDVEQLVRDALRQGVTHDRAFALEIVDELLAAGLLVGENDNTTTL